MIKQQIQAGHSDLGPSSKDWGPGVSGHDEDYTPEKDLWAQTHREGGDGGMRKSSAGRDPRKGTSAEHADDVRRPNPDDEDEKLDEALQESFPASDSPAPAHPNVTGWDIKDEATEKAGGKR
jgi:hypothetical protein